MELLLAEHNDADILLVQEPGFNSHGGIVTHVNWITIHAPWSESDEHARPRAITYVNKELLRCAEVVEVPT